MDQNTEIALNDTESSAINSPHRSKHLPLFAWILYGIAVISAIIYVVSRLSSSFADFFTQNIGSFFRIILAYITNWIPFSLGEAFVVFLPISAVFLIIYANKNHTHSWRAVFIYLATVVSIASLFFSLFFLSFGTGYNATPLDKKLNIDRKDVSPDELFFAAELLAENVNIESENLVYGYDGFSVMPYSYSELSKKLVASYDNVCNKYPFITKFSSNVKPVMLSEPWTYTHISGVYTYFTGEANINTNFPDYTIPFTAAHEMAHQRGISREDEANFVAFLVCTASDDSYIRYSGYLNMYEYLASPLYAASSDNYGKVYTSLNSNIRNEMIAYSKFFDKYRENVVANVSEVINDSSLKIHGTVGTKSYGMVVDLAVAYYRENAD